MTCLPLSLKPVEYIYICAVEKGDLNTGIRWNDNWEEIIVSGLATKRSLCDAQAGWCLDGMFKKNLVYLVKHYVPLDSQITVSSVYSPVLMVFSPPGGLTWKYQHATGESNPLPFIPTQLSHWVHLRDVPRWYPMRNHLMDIETSSELGLTTA